VAKTLIFMALSLTDLKQVTPTGHLCPSALFFCQEITIFGLDLIKDILNIGSRFEQDRE